MENNMKPDMFKTVVSGQLSVVSHKLTVVSKQLSVVSGLASALRLSKKLFVRILCFSVLVAKKSRLPYTVCRLLITIGFLLLITQSIHALEPMLAAYQQEAASNNAKLQAYHYKYLAGTEKITQGKYLSETELTMTYFPTPLAFQNAEQIANFRAMQMFPWFGTSNIRQNESGFYSKADFESYQNIRNQLFFDVSKVFYDLIALEEEKILVQENIRLLNTIKEMVLIRYETGKTSMADLLQIEVEIDELQNHLLNLNDMKIPLNQKFAELLNRDQEDFFALPDTLIALSFVHSLDVMKDSMLKQHPEIIANNYIESAYEAKQKLAKKSGLPSFGLGGEYMMMQDSEGSIGSGMLMPMISIRLPIQRQVYRAREQEAEFNKLAVSFQLNQTQNRLLTEWEEKVRLFRDAQRKIPLYIRQLERLNLALKITVDDYSTGKKSFDDLINIQRLLLDHKLELVNAKKDNNSAVAGLTYLYQRP